MNKKVFFSVLGSKGMDDGDLFRRNERLRSNLSKRGDLIVFFSILADFVPF